MTVRTEFDQAFVTVHKNVAVLTLNQPDVMNAASATMMRGCAAALDFIEGTERFRALVLTGAGRAFCSGADLSSLPLDNDIDAGEMLERLYHPFLRRLRDCRMPIVTAVNGPAVGVGMSFAMMGDLTIAARSAYFLQAFSRLGLVPDGGSTWLLPRLIGLARARELALLAEPLDAEKAMAWGLINFVVEDESLVEDALALATRLASGPRALSLSRRLFWDSPQNGYEAQLALERSAQQAAGRTADFREGLEAFFAKRPSRFRGD